LTVNTVILHLRGRCPGRPATAAIPNFLDRLLDETPRAPGQHLLTDSLSLGHKAYTHTMRSVADDLREELQDEMSRLPFEERLALMLRLGERGLEMFRQANGLDRETAIRELQRQRQASRTPSKCMSELIG
jgi:hypothetical protein